MFGWYWLADACQAAGLTFVLAHALYVKAIHALSKRLEAQMNGNKFKSNTVVAIKLARAVYLMLKNKTVFDPERLVAAMQKCFSPGRRQPARRTGCAKKAMPTLVADDSCCDPSTPVCVGQASNPADSIGTCDQRLTPAAAQTKSMPINPSLLPITAKLVTT